MLWFASFWLTVIVSLIVWGIYSIKQWSIPMVNQVMEFLPGNIAVWAIPVMVLAVYLIVRGLLQRTIAYTESAIDASPRASRTGSRFGESIGDLIFRLFYNPVRWWLSTYAIFLAMVGVLAGFVRWADWIVPGTVFGNWGAGQNLLFSFILLYCFTVVCAWLAPNPPIPLRAIPDRSLDGSLFIPSDNTPIIPESRQAIDIAIGAADPVPVTTVTPAARPTPAPKPVKPPKPPKPPKPVAYRDHFWQFWRIKPPTITTPVVASPSGPAADSGTTAPTATTGPTGVTAESEPTSPPRAGS